MGEPTPAESGEAVEAVEAVEIVRSESVPPTGTTSQPTEDSTPQPALESITRAPPTPASASTSSDQALQSTSAPMNPKAVSSPAPRRPKPPTKGILKPPPPPGKPTLSNRLRDIAGVAKSLFDPLEDQTQASSSSSSAGAGQAPHNHEAEAPSVSSAFTAFSGRLGAGFNRLVVAASQAQAQVQSQSLGGGGTPQGSPMGLRSISLPDVVSPLGLGGGERSKQKQPLKRATFVLPSLSITYPISSQGEPWSLKVVEDRDRVCLLSYDSAV
jgi:protein phosphatase 1 regulatory subunit 37